MLTTKKNLFGVLILIAGLTAALVWFSPEEKTLGSGIKVVYVHVALIWTGMLGIVIAGLLGLVVLFSNKKPLQLWNTNLTWISLSFFTAGLAMSLVAAKINWGAVLWTEPRMQSSLQFLAVALVVQIISSWVPWQQIRGALNALLAVVMLFAILGTPLVLHPESPIRESNSSAIQMTFLGMFVLFVLAATCVTLLFTNQQKKINE